MLQNHLLHGLSAASIDVSSTGSSIDFIFVLVKIFDDDYIFEGLFLKKQNTQICWCFLDSPVLPSLQSYAV